MINGAVQTGIYSADNGLDLEARDVLRAFLRLGERLSGKLVHLGAAKLVHLIAVDIQG